MVVVVVVDYQVELAEALFSEGGGSLTIANLAVGLGTSSHGGHGVV